MGQISVNVGDFNKTSTGTTVYGSTVTFNIPENAGITGCTTTFVTHVNSGSFQDKAFTINGQRGSDSWISTTGVINHSLLVTGANTFRVTMKAQDGKTATWSISNIQLHITYNDPSGGGGGGVGTVSVNPGKVNAGSSITINVSACDAMYTRAIVIRDAAKSIITAVAYNIGTAARTFTFTIPMDWCASLAPNAETAQLYASVEVYKSGNPFTSVQCGFTMLVPSSIVPTIGGFTATRVANGVDASITNYVQGYSGVTLTMSGEAGAYGSTITARKITGAGFSSSAASATFTPLKTAGTLTFTAEVTDSRGRKATKTASVVVQAYSSPVLVSPNAWRSDVNGIQNDTGTYARLYSKISYSSIGGQNTGTLKGRIYPRGATAPAYSSMTPDSPWITGGGTLSTSITYIVDIQVSDKIQSRTMQFDIPTEKVGFDIISGMTGAAIGKAAETSGIFESAWPISVNGVRVLDWKENHPIGSLFFSIYSTSPATLFGGTWAAIPSGRVIRTGSGGTEGGSDTHAHGLSAGYANVATPVGVGHVHIRAKSVSNWKSNKAGPLQSAGINASGTLSEAAMLGGNTDSGINVPLSYHVYAWRRTA